MCTRRSTRGCGGPKARWSGRVLSAVGFRSHVHAPLNSRLWRLGDAVERTRFVARALDLRERCPRHVTTAFAAFTDQRESPASPCIDVCRMNDRGYCEGCLRSIDEIADWSGMTAEEQWAVLDRLGRRSEVDFQ
ncbi:MAG: DUF1289 domain-containing protein [Gammaproteobacteria bacterium]|nr:DUF1289 domain-containing protein [Gammaproteobacteria bacterium]